MTEHQILLIQESFKLIAVDAEEVAGRFYNRLFELDASLRPMFPADLSEQKRKLMMTLKFAIESLQRLDKLIPALEALGRKHTGYGVRDEHYQTVGLALILTIREYLGEAFPASTETAWVEMFGVVANTMQQAAKEVSLPQAA